MAYPAILDRLGRGEPINLAPVGGGCIADARVATFSDGYRVFVKSAGTPGDMFRREAEGLQALAAADGVRVPEVLAVDDRSLILQWVETGRRPTDFFRGFGRDFACLHRHRGPASGFPHDNYIGATPQVNAPLAGRWEDGSDGDGRDWPEFFLERRLRFQAELAGDKGHGSELAGLLDRAGDHILQLLGEALEPPSILHGDLWGGNYLCGRDGEAWLIDPAAYYGHREADLAMTRLFGGFDWEFYAAYEAELPLEAGHEQRLPVYLLYHLLNHLNLFGASYYGQCREILQRLAR